LVVQEELPMPVHALRLCVHVVGLIYVLAMLGGLSAAVGAQDPRPAVTAPHETPARGRVRPRVPTSFDQLSVLTAPGDRVTVTDTSGNRYSGRIADLSASTLSVRVGSNLRELREADVVLIRQRRDDTLRNGALWGLGAGATTGMLTCGTCHIGPGLMMAGLWGGIGAGIGVGIDAIIRGQATVFERPGASGTKVIVAPRLSPSHQGVMVSVTF
jgi:hypothetical protein